MEEFLSSNLYGPSLSHFVRWANGDGLHGLVRGSFKHLERWRDRPGSDDEIEAGRTVPDFNSVADLSGTRGQGKDSRKVLC
jgi:hypothetical protein